MADPDQDFIDAVRGSPSPQAAYTTGTTDPDQDFIDAVRNNGTAVAPSPSATPQTDQASSASSSLFDHVLSQKDYMAMHGYRAPPAAAQAIAANVFQGLVGSVKPLARFAVSTPNLQVSAQEPGAGFIKSGGGFNWPVLAPVPGVTAAQARQQQETALQNPLINWTQQAPEWAARAFPIPPGQENKWYSQTAHAAGSLAPILASGLAAPMVIGAETYGDVVERTYKENIAKGMSEEDASADAFNKAGAGGATATALWAVLPRPLKTLFDKYVIDKIGWEGAKRFFLNRAVQGAEGATIGAGTQIPINIATGRPAMEDVGTTSAGLGVAQMFFPRGMTAKEIRTDKQVEEAVNEFLGRGKPIPPPPIQAPETLAPETADISKVREAQKPPEGGEKVAIEPSDAQVQGGPAAQRQQAPPDGSIPQPGDSDYVVGKEEGAGARGEVPSEPVPTEPAVVTPPSEKTHEPPKVETNDEAIARLEKDLKEAGDRGELMDREKGLELQNRRAIRDMPGLEPAAPEAGDTPEVKNQKAAIVDYALKNPGSNVPARFWRRLDKVQNDTKAEEAIAEQQKVINRKLISQLLTPEELQQHANLKSKWSQLNVAFKLALERGDGPAGFDIAEKQAAIKRQMDDIENKLPGAHIYDVIGIGAGPTNLLAAIHAGAEGLKMRVLDIKMPGGGSKFTPAYENVSGALGQTGRERALVGQKAAERHGTQFQQIGGLDGPPVYDPKTKLWTIKTKGPGEGGAGGETFVTRTWIGATGARARGAPFPIFDATGNPVTRGAFTPLDQKNPLPVTGSKGDKSGMRVYLDNGKSAAVAANGDVTAAIGGANSAGQGVMDMAITAMKKGATPQQLQDIKDGYLRPRTASDQGQPVHVMFRGAQRDMSGYLQNDVSEMVRLGWVIEHPHTEVDHAFARGDEKVLVLKKAGGKRGEPAEITGELPVKEVAAFTGGDPITDWMPPGYKKVVDKVVKGTEVETPSEKGLVKTSWDLKPVDESNVPSEKGDFVAGSVRYRATNRMVSSEGEGVQAIDHIAKFITKQEKANLLPTWKMQLRSSFNRGEYERKLKEEGVEPTPSTELPVEHPAPEQRLRPEELSQREHRAYDVFSELKRRLPAGDPRVAAAWREVLKTRADLAAETGEVRQTERATGKTTAPSRLIPSPVIPPTPKEVKPHVPPGAVPQQQQETELPTPKGAPKLGPLASKYTESGQTEASIVKDLFDRTNRDREAQIAQEFNLNTVTPRGADIAARQIYNFSQKNLRDVRKLPDTVTVYRAGPISDDVVGVTLDRQVAQRNSDRYGDPVEEYTVPRKQILADVEAIRPQGYQEAELLVHPENLKKTALEPTVAERQVADQAADTRANQRMAENPQYADELITDIGSGKKRSLDGADEKVLLKKQEQLLRDRDLAGKRATNEKLTPDERKTAASTFEDLDNQVRQMDAVTNNGDSFRGQNNNLQWHQFKQKDYQQPAMEQKLQVAKGGAALTPEEIASLKKSTDRLAQAMSDVENIKRRTGWRPGLGSKVDPGLRKAQYEAFQAKQALDDAIWKAKMKSQGIIRRVARTAGEIGSIPRAIMASTDLSAVRRQGGLLFMSHPIRSIRIMPDMIRAAKSDQAYFKLMQDIRERPNADLYVSSKLGLTDIKSPKLSQLEEMYMSRWADAIPLVAHSQRAYVYFLNRLRADTFDAMAATLGKHGVVTAAQADALSNFINVFTGRGNVGEHGQALALLNQWFFAPRYTLSRFQTLTAQPLRYANDPAARKMIAMEYARTLMGYAVVFGLASTVGKDMGVTVEYDPRSSDFGKIKIGNTRVDLLSGLAQVTVLLGRMATRQTKTATGQIEPLGGPKQPFSQRNISNIYTDFVRSKLSPIPSAVWNAQKGQRVTGEPTTLTKEALGLITPMSGNDVVQALQEHGLAKGTILGLIALFGDSVNTYSTKIKPARQQQIHRTRYQ